MALPYDTGFKKKKNEIHCQNVKLYKKKKKEKKNKKWF